MYKLIRLFNQNRKAIVKFIIIIVFVIALIQLLNYISKKNIEKNQEDLNNIYTNNNYKNEEKNTSVISSQSAITGTTIPASKLKKETGIIDKFVESCNKKDINGAYELITDECKNEMFPTVQDFINIYYSKLFNGDSKTHTIENWTKSTYIVKIIDNVLASGIINENSTKQDYITVVETEKNEYKLNINNYISYNIINRDTNYNNKKIVITVNNSNTYMNYEVYNLTIKNNSENTILLDTSDDTKSVYLLDSKGMKYYFYSNEINKNLLKILAGGQSTLNIKFMNTYSSTRKVENIIFDKFILNYKEYDSLENKKEYKDFVQLKVNL